MVSILNVLHLVVNKDITEGRFISATCKGVKCSLCGDDATNKVGEEIPDDHPLGNERHNLTAYLCAKHFDKLMGRTEERDICDLETLCIELNEDEIEEDVIFEHEGILYTFHYDNYIDCCNDYGKYNTLEFSDDVPHMVSNGIYSKF